MLCNVPVPLLTLGLCILRSPNQHTVALFLRDSSGVRWNVNEHFVEKSQKVHLEITILFLFALLPSSGLYVKES